MLFENQLAFAYNGVDAGPIVKRYYAAFALLKSGSDSRWVHNMKVFWQLVLSLLVGVPTGLIAAFLATPLWWKLEPITGLELAGHSGPADWLLAACTGSFVIIAFLVIRLSTSNRGGSTILK